MNSINPINFGDLSTIANNILASGILPATVSFAPGMVVPCQLGNSFDSDYCPSAPILLLSTTMSCSGVDFYAVAKKSNGKLLILRNVTDGNGKTVPDGVGYCTAACDLDSPYLVAMFGEGGVGQIKHSLIWHSKKVEALPSFESLPVNGQWL